MEKTISGPYSPLHSKGPMRYLGVAKHNMFVFDKLSKIRFQGEGRDHKARCGVYDIDALED